MKLKQWQKKHGFSDQMVADAVGYKDASMVFYINQGKRKPSPKKAHQIIKLTEHKVTLKDLYPEETAA